MKARSAARDASSEAAPDAGADLVLVGDIGGTNSRLALAQGTDLWPETIARFRNADFPGFDAVLQTYLAGAEAPPNAACIAVAGPVRNGVAAMTNLDWKLSERALSAHTGLGRAALINDLQAQGHALQDLPPAAMRAVLGPLPVAGRETCLVVGIGTGFNAAPVHRIAAGLVVPASECGHAMLPMPRAEDRALLQVTEGEFVAIEDVLSGNGIARLDAALAARDGGATPRTPNAVIEALAMGDPRATVVGEILARHLGAVIGDLALTHLPFGGIWMAGGVARALAPHLAELGFAEALRDKGRFSEFMNQFAIAVIEDDFAALAGCARFMEQAWSPQLLHLPPPASEIPPEKL